MENWKQHSAPGAICFGSDAGEVPEVPDEVGLVVVAALEGEIVPVEAAAATRRTRK